LSPHGAPSRPLSCPIGALRGSLRGSLRKERRKKSKDHQIFKKDFIISLFRKAKETQSLQKTHPIKDINEID
jgi:hypothetical protein